MESRYFLYLVVVLFLSLIFLIISSQSIFEGWETLSGDWHVSRKTTSNGYQTYDHHIWTGVCYNGLRKTPTKSGSDDNCNGPYDDNYQTIPNNCNNGESVFTSVNTIQSCPSTKSLLDQRNTTCSNAIKNSTNPSDKSINTFNDNQLVNKTQNNIKNIITNQINTCKSYNVCSNPNSTFIGLGDIQACPALKTAMDTRTSDCQNAQSFATDQSVLAYNDTNLLKQTYSTIYSTLVNEDTSCKSVYNCTNTSQVLNSTGIQKCLKTPISDTRAVCNNAIDLAHNLDADTGDHNDALYLQTLFDKTMNIDISNVSVSTATKVLDTTKKTCSEYYDKFKYWQSLEDVELSKPCRPEPSISLPMDTEITSTLTEYSKTTAEYLDDIIAKLQLYIDELAPKGNFSNKMMIDISNLEWSPPGTVPIITISNNFPQTVNIVMPKGYVGEDGAKGMMGGIGQIGPIGEAGKSGSTGTWSLPEQYYHIGSVAGATPSTLN